MKRVLVVATSRKTRGGITSVIKAHEQGAQWKEFNCKWIETVRDGHSIVKVGYFIKALAQFLYFLPTAQLIHVHSALGTSIKRKNIFISIARLFRKKVILHFHAAEYSILDNEKDNKNYRKIFIKADNIIVLSNSWKELIENRLDIDPNKVIILHNPAPKVERGIVKENFILFAGSLIKRKGYDTLIKAFGAISKSYPNWTLILAGNGEISNAKKLISQYKLDDKVILPGWVTGERKNLLFKKASIFCLPSHAEGFPMAILDAWAYGIPCVMTPVGGIPELVRADKDGIIVPVDNVIQLSQALIKLIESKELRNQIIGNTDNRIMEDFNIDKINNYLGIIYSNLIG